MVVVHVVADDAVVAIVVDGVVDVVGVAVAVACGGVLVSSTAW